MGTRLEDAAVVAEVGSAAALEITTHIIGGKWKGIILYHLIDGALRFNQLRRLIPGITQRMLTLQLRELEKNGIIERLVGPSTPLRVDYRLSDWGRTLVPILELMLAWGNRYSESKPAGSTR